MAVDDARHLDGALVGAAQVRLGQAGHFGRKARVRVLVDGGALHGHFGVAVHLGVRSGVDRGAFRARKSKSPATGTGAPADSRVDQPADPECAAGLPIPQCAGAYLLGRARRRRQGLHVRHGLHSEGQHGLQVK